MKLDGKPEPDYRRDGDRVVFTAAQWLAWGRRKRGPWMRRRA